MRDIGELLRRTRQEKGLSLRDVQVETKIRTKYLEALERGDDSAIPGEVYCRGFLKSYANFLGLDGQELAARYAALKQAEREAKKQEGEVERTETGRPKTPGRAEHVAAPRKRGTTGPRRRSTSAGSPRLLTLLVLLILAAALVAWWAWQTGALVALLPSLAPGQPVPSKPGTPADSDGSGGESTPVESGGAGPAPVTPGPALERATVRPGRVDILVRGVDRLELRASFKQRCWGRVTLDGRVHEETTFSAGEERSWTASDTASFRLGNAGNVVLTVNGAEAGPLGGVGQPVTVNIEKTASP